MECRRVRYVSVALLLFSCLGCRRNVQQDYKTAQVETTVTGLHSSDEGIRVNSVVVLQELGPQARSAIPELTGLLQTDPCPTVRWSAALALRRIGGDSPEILATLRLALGDS